MLKTKAAVTAELQRRIALIAKQNGAPRRKDCSEAALAGLRRSMGALWPHIVYSAQVAARASTLSPRDFEKMEAKVGTWFFVVNFSVVGKMVSEKLRASVMPPPVADAARAGLSMQRRGKEIGLTDKAVARLLGRGA